MEGGTGLIFAIFTGAMAAVRNRVFAKNPVSM